MVPKNARTDQRYYALANSRIEILRSIAERLAPESRYFFGMLQHYTPDLSAAIWFEKSRPGRSQTVEYLKRCIGRQDPNTESELKAYFNRAPYATVHYSLTRMAGSSDPYEKARWLLKTWSSGKNAKQGRGKLYPGKMHPKVIVIAFALALLEHLGKEKTASRDVTDLAAELYRATAPHKSTWVDTPYHSWRPHLADAKKRNRKRQTQRPVPLVAEIIPSS